ncbi:putative zinc finger, CCHC-type containing protein [Tanacetum coccineum]
MAEPENAESTVQFDAEEYEEHQENPNQETPTEFPKSDIKQYFTFDDPPRTSQRTVITQVLAEDPPTSIQQSISPEAFSGRCRIYDSRIPVSEMPLVNPYQIFTKPTSSITKRVKQLIGSAPNKQIKEFVQTSKFDSHQLPASQVEHLVSLSLPSDLPRHCLAQGYTHIHFGAIRLALTFHGRKGLPAYSRIALLDTRFVEYQHACIGTIQTTLNAGTIFVTFYPNFNMPLNDPSLLTALKAQIQIGGTPQVNTFQATFHYQMAYRVQNHSLDILVPGQDNAGDALMIDVDSNATPTCTYVPRQLSREELVKLLPEKWITNYEQIHQAPVRSTSAPEFVRHENGLVEIKFSSSQPKSDNVFPTGIHMITPTDQEPAQEIKHIWWDVCNCESCLDEAAKIDDDDEDLPKKRKSSQQKLKRRYEKGDPTVGLLGEPSGKFDYYVLYPKAEPSQPLSPPHKTPPSPHKPPPTSPPPPKLSPYNQKALSILHQDSPVFPITKGPSCSYSQEYEQEFPALTAFEHLDSRTKHDWKIKNPTTIGPTGQANTISPAEATLNWQSENVVAQNKVLVKILSQQGMITNSQEYLSSRVRSLESIINELRFKIQELHREIIQIIQTSPTTQPSSSISQKEAEMKNLKNQLQDLERQHKQKRITSLIDDPWRLPSTPFNQQSLLSLLLADVVASTKTLDVLPIQKVNPVSMFLNSLAQTDKPQNPQETPTEFSNIIPLPNQETPTEFPKYDIKQYFTFDDIPPSKWSERSIEMLTWCTAESQYYTIDVVIKRFLTRLQGRLRDRYHNLGEYHQLQIQQSISPEAFMSIIYSEFNGSPWEHTTHAREEFLKMKLDDVNQKQVFLNSFLESLRNEAYRALEARNVTIAQTTLGELYQLILNALAKLYNQKKFLAEFERTGKRLRTACDDKYLQIKCKDKRSSKKWKFIRKKKQRGRTSDRCFICKKRGHFAKNCPDKKRSQALIQALNQVEPVDVSDLESLYYLDDEPSDSVFCMIAYSDFSSDDDSDTNSLESDSDFGVHMINPIPHILPIQEDPPLPLVKVYLLTDAYAKPIPVIAFFDTGSLVSILNPNILPGEGLHYRSFFNPWTAMHRLFVASITPPIFNISSIKQRLIQTCCASSHTEFLTKHPSLLWLNPLFFVSLPFKQNEDVNPTKASHPRMNPDHYQLAKEECEQLVSQGIIEPTTSPWACEAFYVNKRSEQVRGKLRLVINYQPLNHFLADDKFPLPQKKSLFQTTWQNAKTDASDECWGAVLLVQDNNNKRHVCGYKSGTFKASEQHYHSTFKEILAVKRGIEKFQFHLIGHEFQVEMDMYSFPHMLQFKRKMLPHAQLLRWSNWFSQWKFTVKHIKGTENVLADFLSRPKAYKSEENYLKYASQV